MISFATEISVFIKVSPKLSGDRIWRIHYSINNMGCQGAERHKASLGKGYFRLGAPGKRWVIIEQKREEQAPPLPMDKESSDKRWVLIEQKRTNK